MCAAATSCPATVPGAARGPCPRSGMALCGLPVRVDRARLPDRDVRRYVLQSSEPWECHAILEARNYSFPTIPLISLAVNARNVSVRTVPSALILRPASAAVSSSLKSNTPTMS